jgi:hypothetical protein
VPVDTVTRAWLALNHLPRPHVEHRFATPRRWRFDWAWPTFKVALEIEGGVWTRGRHTRGKGFLADMDKYNRAAILGWCVLRIPPSALYTSTNAQLITEALVARGWSPVAPGGA